MNRNLRKPLNELDVAKTNLTNVVFEELDKAARKMNLDSMSFYFYTVLMRRGVEVKSKTIEAIEEVYLDNVHAAGFLAFWNKETGWGKGNKNESQSGYS